MRRRWRRRRRPMGSRGDHGDDEVMLVILDTWDECCRRGVYPSTAILRRATRMSTNRLVEIRDRMIRSGLLVLPAGLQERIERQRGGQLPAALRATRAYA